MYAFSKELIVFVYDSANFHMEDIQGNYHSSFWSYQMVLLLLLQCLFLWSFVSSCSSDKNLCALCLH